MIVGFLLGNYFDPGFLQGRKLKEGKTYCATDLSTQGKK
jgi:hypothetical protein